MTTAATTLELFLELPGTDQVTEFIRKYADVHQLASEDVGKSWGIGLDKSNKGRTVRINAWHQQLVACVYRRADGWSVFVATPQSGQVEDLLDRWADEDLSVEDGQTAAMAEQWFVGGSPAIMLQLLSDTDFVAASAEVVEKVRGRNLWDKRWANSEAGEYFFGEGVRVSPAPRVAGTGDRPFTQRTEDHSIPDWDRSLQDSDNYERGLNRHQELTNELAALLDKRGFEPRLPTDGPQWDIAWRNGNSRLHIVEVKSLTPSNEEGQLRLGLGQVLRYRWRHQNEGDSVVPILYAERAPTDSAWFEVCRDVGVILLCPELVETWLDSSD